MSYNLFAETDKIVNWSMLHSRIFKPNAMIELVPMTKLGINGGDALGISVPAKNTGIKIWDEFETLINIIKEEYHFRIFDLYYGAEIDVNLMSKIKKNLTEND